MSGPRATTVHPDRHIRFGDFVAAVAERLHRGAESYGDRSFDLESPTLLDEILEELEDVAGWSFILWTRLRRIRDVLAFAERPSLPEEEVQDHDQEQAGVQDDLSDEEAPGIVRTAEHAASSRATETDAI